MTIGVKAPDAEADRKAVAQAGQGGKRKYWKPKAGDNLIRILPARADAPANVNYHLLFAKHIIRFGDQDWESFVCPLETYGKPCPVCEKRIQLLTQAKATGDEKLKNDAMRYRTNRAGMFNIIDMTDPAVGVQLYESAYIFWRTIVKLVSTDKGKYSDIILKRNPDGQLALSEAGVPYSRQVIIYYNPKESNPGRKYEIYPDESSPIAPDAKAFETLMEGVIHLDIAKFYPEPTYEEIKIRAFGTADERSALRASRNSAKQAEPAEGDDEETPEQKPSAATVQPPAAAAPAVAPTPAPAPVPAIARPTDSDVLADVKRRVANLRNKPA